MISGKVRGHLMYRLLLVYTLRNARTRCETLRKNTDRGRELQLVI